MKKVLIFSVFCIFNAAQLLFGQFIQTPENISGQVKVLAIPEDPTQISLQRRSSVQPKNCTSDTVQFTAYGSTAYGGISIRSGSSLGQFFGAPQNINIQGFKFYAYAIPTSPPRNYTINIRCNIYKAGADSLPTGLPIASDTVMVDTVMGSSIPLARIERLAWFNTSLSTTDAYIVVLECDSTNVSAGVVANNWSAGDGRRRNLACGSVSGRWYRALNLNIGGVTLDADMQFYPVVKYQFGTDFLSNYECFPNDTLRFTNQLKKNVSGSPFYNYYVYYNLSRFSHRWNYGDGGFDYYQEDGKIKYANKKNYDVRLISTVFQYKGTQCIDTTIKRMYFKPDVPQLNGKNQFCRGDTAKLTVYSNLDASIEWYKGVFDSVPFHTGTQYSIANFQKSDTFYLKAVNGNCESAYLILLAKLFEYPDDPLVISDSICAGGNAVLSATSNAGIAEWFKDSNATQFIQNGTYFTTGTLYDDTFYYVRFNNASCLNKGGIKKIAVEVGSDFAPSIPVISYDTFHCLREIGTGILLKAQGSDTIRWYDRPTAGRLQGKGDSLNFVPVINGTYKLYIESWNGVCASGRAEALIVVNDYPDITQKVGYTGCFGSTVTPSAKVSFGKIYWYLDKNAPFPIDTGFNPTIPPLPTGTHYIYLKTGEGNCQMPNFDSVAVTINAAPEPSSVVANAVCFKSLGEATVNIPLGNVHWYSDTNQPPIFTGKTWKAGILLGNVTVYYQTENSGCKSPFKPITVAIKPRPTAGFTWELRWKNRLVCTPISTSNMTFAWNWGDGKTSGGLPAVHDYQEEGNYTVRLITTSTTNGCKDTADIPVVINHMNNENLEKRITHYVFPNPIQHGKTLKIDGINQTQVNVAIFGLDGKEWFSETLENIENRHSLIIPYRIPNGTYYLCIYTEGKTLFVPILILP